MKNIVVIGGGTGSYTLLTGLSKLKNVHLSSIVTMADDGGSNKVLRDEFGLLPTSGIRQSVVALSKQKSMLRDLFNYRYSQGIGIAGMTFGNLFMAALTDIKGSQRDAIKETCRLLQVKGDILPVSYEKTSLLAVYQDGTEILGEHYIDVSNPKVAKQKIIDFRTLPTVSLDQEAASAIAQADYLILGPGDLYTNTIANLVVKGMTDAIKKSHAKLIFIINLMAKPGETYQYQASDFFRDLSKYLPNKPPNYALINSDHTIPQRILNSYAKEDSYPVIDDVGDEYLGTKIIRAPVISHQVVKKSQADRVKRSMLRHDPDLLAQVLSKIFSGKI